MAGVFGMDGIFRVRDRDPGVLTTGDGDGDDSTTGIGGGIGGAETTKTTTTTMISISMIKTGLSSGRSATEFYEGFLVPRLVASASASTPKGSMGRGRSSEGMSVPREGVAGVSALKTIAEMFLLAEDGEKPHARIFGKRASEPS